MYKKRKKKKKKTHTWKNCSCIVLSGSYFRVYSSNQWSLDCSEGEKVEGREEEKEEEFKLLITGDVRVAIEIRQLVIAWKKYLSLHFSSFTGSFWLLFLSSPFTSKPDYKNPLYPVRRLRLRRRPRRRTFHRKEIGTWNVYRLSESKWKNDSYKLVNSQGDISTGNKVRWFTW